jgi:hypothetical protein
MSLATRRTTVLGIKTVFTARSYIFRTYATSGSNWVPAQTPGENPLYDMALEVIQEDSDRLQVISEQLTSQKDNLQHPKREQLEILSQMNRPDILWNFERGQGQLVYINMNNTNLEIINSGHVKGGF